MTRDLLVTLCELAERVRGAGTLPGFFTHAARSSPRLARLRQTMHRVVDALGRQLHSGARLKGMHRLTEALRTLEEVPASITQRSIRRGSRPMHVEHRNDPLRREMSAVLAAIGARVIRPNEIRHLLRATTATILVDRHGQPRDGASWSARHTRFGMSGVSINASRSSGKAFSTALTTAPSGLVTPDSPTPLQPVSVNGDAVSCISITQLGISTAVGRV